MEAMDGKTLTGRRVRWAIDLNVCASQMEETNLENALHATHGCDNSDLSNKIEREAADAELDSDEREDGSIATRLVKQYHGMLKKSVGETAPTPGEAGLEKDGRLIICRCCNNTESLGTTIICDACDSSFHIGCMKLRQAQVAKLDDWVCRTCNARSIQVRWPVGRIAAANEVQEVVTGRSGASSLISDKERSGRNKAKLAVGGAHEGRLRKPKRKLEAANEDLSKRRLSTSDSTDLVEFEFVNRLQLPLECMDMMFESFGAVDLRPGYSDANHTWPVGFCSLWHDAGTGSLCTSQVLEGGPSGPIFRVTRRPCSSMPELKSTFATYDNQGQGRLCNVVQTNDIYIGNGGTGNSCKQDAEREQLNKADSNSIFNVETSSGQLHDDDDELHILISSLQTSVQEDSFLCKELVEGINFKDVEIMSTDASNDRTAVIELDKCLGLGGNENASVPGNRCTLARSEILGSVNLFEDSRQLVVEEKVKQNQNIVELAQCSRSSNGNSEEIPMNGKYNTTCLNDGIGEITVEATSSGEAWIRLAKEFAVRYRECLKLSTNSPVSCLHLEAGSGFPGSYLEDFRGIHVTGELGNKGDDSETLCNALEDWIGQDRYGFDIPIVEKVIRARKTEAEAIRPPPPPGQPIGRKFPTELVGDLLQIWEFLCRFYELLGMKDPPSLNDLEEGLCDSLLNETRNDNSKESTAQREKHDDDQFFIPPETNSNESFNQSVQHSQYDKFLHGGMYCHSTVLVAIHISLLKILLGDLQPKVLGSLDATSDTKRGKKRDGESSFRKKNQSCGLLPLNEMTWPEVVRRYIIGLTLMDIPGENMELSVQEHRKYIRCFLGDGGMLCGALEGVAGLETDAQLLAEAVKQVFGQRSSVETKKISNDKNTKEQSEDDSKMPEWAVVLEPVRKLATNVGARIRNCVRDALSRDPPEWAKEILEWSISKEVYKGNASGPTKRAVLQVLAQVMSQEPKTKINVVKMKSFLIPTPALVMRRCRLILRQLITSDEWRVFCNLLSGTVLGYYERKDDRSELAPVMVPRPLDFRIIDSRLAYGAYRESHESFLADIQQLWKNIPVIFHDREDMIKVGESLSQKFDALYQERVINLINHKEELGEIVNLESSTGLDEKFMKAPWEEGVCKICGIDKDDDLVLLCDGCDAEYHIYCLSPPLSKIPEGNWYCPTCISHDKELINSTEEINKVSVGGVSHAKATKEKNWLISVCNSLGEREYWQLNVKEKILLLKFLCDKALDSGVIRDHLEQFGDTSLELQQKLQLLLLEYQSHAIRGNSIAEENSEIASRETLRPKRRSCKNVKEFDVGVLVEETEFPARASEETEKVDADYLVEGGDSDILPTKVNVKTKQRLDSQPGMPQHALFPSKVHGITKTTDGLLTDLNIPLEVLTEEQEGSNRNESVSMSVTEFKEKSQSSSREVLEFPVKFPADVPQEEPFKHYGKLDGKPEEHWKVDHIEVGSIRQSELVRISKENGNGLLIPPFITQQQLQDIPKDCETNNVNFNGTIKASVKLTSSISPETLAATLQDNKVTECVGEDPSLNLNHGVISGGRRILLPQVNTGEQVASPAENAMDELSWHAQTANPLETEIESIEAEIRRTALRRECLGRDLIDRIYWALLCDGRFPYLAVEVGNSYSQNRNLEKENKEISSYDKTNNTFTYNCNIAGIKHQPLIETDDLISNGRESDVKNWIMYETDTDFEQLLQWLNPKNQKEKNLISAIMQWQMLFSYRFHRESSTKDIIHKQQIKMKAPGAFPGTKATLPYVRKHGPIMWPEKLFDLHVRKRGRVKKAQPEDGMFRCDCLELVWPTRCHCELCHETCESSVELRNHNNGVCFSRLSALQKQSANMPAIVKLKKRKGDTHIGSIGEDGMHVDRHRKLNSKRHASSSFDFSVVAKRFYIQSSTREQILKIGCIADGGPIFVPAPPFLLDFDSSPSLGHVNGNTDARSVSGTTNLPSKSPVCNHAVNGGIQLEEWQEWQPSTWQNRTHSADMVGAMPLGGTVSTLADKNFQSLEIEDIHQNAVNVSQSSGRQDADIISFIPVASMQPLSARNSAFFKRLKANLLDIETVLNQEAFEHSRGDAVWRRSWRFFVKSATSIYGLVQALITLEQMLNPDCLKESWCYWASLSAAVRTTTLSSLALRIFSLDAAIKYKNFRVDFDFKNDEKTCKR